MAVRYLQVIDGNIGDAKIRVTVDMSADHDHVGSVQSKVTNAVVQLIASAGGMATAERPELTSVGDTGAAHVAGSAP